MANYVVFENIPNTAEGWAFLKLLRKYLRKDFHMRSRGRHANRKALAKELVAKGVYCDRFGNTAEYVHKKLRTGMSCKYADRITCVVDDRTVVSAPLFKRIDTGGWAYRDTYHSSCGWIYTGDFPTRSAAKAAMILTKGISK